MVIGKQTREDHLQIMNACIRLYADAAETRIKKENGFELTDYDIRTLAYARDYTAELLSIDVQMDMDEMLNKAWQLISKHFQPDETGIRQELVDRYWMN